MQNQIQVFENKEFGKVRVVEKDGQPWFVGKDVAAILGYTNTRKALSDHVDKDDVTNRYPIIDALGRTQNVVIINESGLYCLIFASKLPAAKAFKLYVASEILPSVRKHGAYITDETLQKMREDEAFTEELTARLSGERAKNTALLEKVEQLAPKAGYCDIVLQCENAVQTTIIAKDYGMSACAFNKLLHGFGIQFKMGETWVLYEKFAGKGYTLTRTYHVNENTSTIHTYWTQRGRLFLYDFLKWYGIPPLAERTGAALIGGNDNRGT